MSGKAFDLSAPSVRRKKAAETKHVKEVRMKISCLLRPAVFLGLLAFCLCLSSAALAEDMRAASRKARAQYEAAQARERESRERIQKDRGALEREVAALEQRSRKFELEIQALNAEIQELDNSTRALNEEQAEANTGLREISGSVRVAARDLETQLSQSLLTAAHPEYRKILEPVLEKDRSPDLKDAGALADLFFQAMDESGAVTLQTRSFVGRDGREESGEVLLVGPFLGAYRTSAETGFLRFSEDTGQLFALSALPDWLVRRNLDKYFDGASDSVELDISGGAALRQVMHTNSLLDQIRSGGLLVWPILAIAFFALVMALERTIFLKRVHDNADRLMDKVNTLARQGRWEDCEQALCSRGSGRPVCNVLRAGLEARGETRETLESVLQEAILRELPRLDRFLPMLNMLGSVAPLLGLLGTVTGMISTFHVITLYGTGDPRMMSGGISEALVTTMLGLAVAIPIMLVHTFLSRRVDHIVGDMEEQAVALTNILYRESTCGGAHVE